VKIVRNFTKDENITSTNTTATTSNKKTNHNSDKPQETVINNEAITSTQSKSSPSIEASLQVLSESIIKSLVKWNEQHKKFTNSYERGLLSKMNEYQYMISRGKAPSEEVSKKAKSCLKRAIELGFEINKKY